ncbi:radical SAM protein [Paraeggerthella sp.]|uniref:radical SAM protein n=1 Tax=Paraeggerthella sp. TaxID=2897350 RepID=UPI0035288CCA
MDGIKRLILGLIPNQKCNLKCEYCYISQLDAWEDQTQMKYTPEHIARSLSKERLGGVSLINLTGNGETFIQAEVPQIAKCLLAEGHYVEIVTNGLITRRIQETLDCPEDWRKRLFFKLSFHYRELLDRNLMDRFFENMRLIRDSGASFTLELLAYDEIEKDIDDIIKVTREKSGAVCQATIGRNQHHSADLLSAHSPEEFREIWKSLSSPMMDLKLDMLNVKRREFCYAGAWSLFVNLATGESQPCYWQPYNQNIFKNPEKPIMFDPVGYNCTQPFCINAHAHLTWGLIPELDTPPYEVMRNRVCSNGTEWLSEECKCFFNTRLYESNVQYSSSRKTIHRLLYPARMLKWFCGNFQENAKRVRKHVVRKKKWDKEEG